MHIFVRKVEHEDGITLPFTYIGKGVPHYSSGPKENGAHLFRVEADYSEGSEMDSLIKAIVDKTAANELLEDKHYRDIADAFGL